jgi:hypothetical protein
MIGLSGYFIYTNVASPGTISATDDGYPGQMQLLMKTSLLPLWMEMNHKRVDMNL